MTVLQAYSYIISMSDLKNYSHQELLDLLIKYPFKDSRKAYQNLNRILERIKGNFKPVSMLETPGVSVGVNSTKSSPPDSALNALPGSFLAKLLEAAHQAPDPDSALNNLERYLEAVPRPGDFLSKIEENPIVLQVLMHLFGTSPYLSDILIRNPHYLSWLADLDKLRSPKSKDLLYRELTEFLSGGGAPSPLSKKEKLALLRIFKKREILRIGVRDILRYGSVKEITEELSDLADVLIQGAYEICDAELKKKYGTPYYPDSQGGWRECKFTVLGMGKLGGRGLNFSSDIDLMYLYSADPGETSGSREGKQKHSISNPEYFKKLSTEITSALSDVTPEGYVYRVDLRLRPEGKSGNIAYSLRSYEVYYESWGETWERLALIKARPVAGDMELGEAFLKMIRPFVYRKYMDYGAINEIKALKDRIDRKVFISGEKNLHVKLGFGGIREIEFSVQVLQLLYGGKIPQIQERNTLLALEKLLQHNLFSQEDYTHLRDAYLFLRDVEHKLQIVHEFQTHTLPTDPEKLELCARRLGYRPIPGERTSTATEQFMHDYRLHTFRVNRIFQSLFEGSLDRSSSGTGLSSQITPEATMIRNQDFPKEQAYQILQKYGFRDIPRAYHIILLLRDGPVFVHYSAKTRGLLATIMPFILEYASQSPDPDQALNHLEKFVSVAGARTTLYALLANNPKVIELLLQLFGHSDFLSEILIRYPDMLDVLLNPEVIEQTRSREQMYQELQVAVGLKSPPAPEVSPDSIPTDLPSRISKLRQFKQAEMLRIGLRDIMGKADFPTTLKALSDLADVCVQVAYEIAQKELQRRYGIPQVNGKECAFAIMGMGKLGGRELNYTSDLDVLYVYDKNGMTTGAGQNRDLPEKTSEPPIQIENYLYFLKLIELLNKILGEPSVDPVAFKLDPRLRPEGRKGPLAIPFENYREYYQTRAETWERQALIKVRFIAGSENLGHSFIRMAHDYIYRKDADSYRRIPLRAEIREMKKKMEAKIALEVLERSHHVKLGSGGIVDIEFIVQFLQLQYGPQNPSVRQAGTLPALESLYREGFLPEADYKQLKESYIFLRTVENRLGIVQELPIKILPTSPEDRLKLAKRMGYVGDQAGETFLKDYEKHTTAVRELYKKIFWSS